MNNVLSGSSGYNLHKLEHVLHLLDNEDGLSFFCHLFDESHFILVYVRIRRNPPKANPPKANPPNANPPKENPPNANPFVTGEDNSNSSTYKDSFTSYTDEDSPTPNSTNSTSEDQWIATLHVMNSLPAITMSGIWEKLKKDLAVAWKRHHDSDSDVPTLNFADSINIEVPTQRPDGNDCLIASCCFLWHFYKNKLDSVEDLSVLNSSAKYYVCIFDKS